MKYVYVLQEEYDESWEGVYGSLKRAMEAQPGEWNRHMDDYAMWRMREGRSWWFIKRVKVVC